MKIPFLTIVFRTNKWESFRWQNIKPYKIPKKSQKITVKNNMKKITHPFECSPNVCTSVQQNALYFTCSTAYFFFEWMTLICYCDRASGGLQRLEILRNAFFLSGMGCNMALYQVPEGISWVWKRMIIDVFRIDSILTTRATKKSHFLLRLFFTSSTNASFISPYLC